MATGTFTDSRDGIEYAWRTIGTYKWFTSNFKHLPYVDRVSSSNYGIWVYGYDGIDTSVAGATDNYSTYGALYNYEAALEYCPSGCRFPSDEDWKDMEKELGMYYTEADLMFIRNTADEGETMKNDSGWYLDMNGTNTSYFTGLPGGYRNSEQFESLTKFGLFWTSKLLQTEGSAVMRMLSYSDSSVYRFPWPVTSGLSVRYIVE